MRTTRHIWIEFKTREELEDIYKKYFRVAIIFNNTSDRDKVTYTLTIPRENFPFGIKQTIGNIGLKLKLKETKNYLFLFSANCREKPFQKSKEWGQSKCPEMLYYTEGYTLVQQIIDSSIIRVNHLSE